MLFFFTLSKALFLFTLRANSVPILRLQMYACVRAHENTGREPPSQSAAQ